MHVGRRADHRTGQRLQDLWTQSEGTGFRPLFQRRGQGRGPTSDRPCSRHARHLILGEPGRDLRGHGPVRLRQVHRHPDSEQTPRRDPWSGHGGGHQRPGTDRRGSPSFSPREAGHGFPALRPVPPPQRHRQHGLRPQGPRRREAGAARGGHRGPSHGRP